MNLRARLLRLTVAVTASAFLVTACGGRKPDPVATYKIGDEKLTCDGIRAELAFIDQQVSKLIPESKKTGKNVALGTAGLFLIVPFFFMDVSDAERVEIEAYQKRALSLEQIAQSKNCDPPSVNPPEGAEKAGVSAGPPSVPVATAEDIAKKLQVLEQLMQSGAITEAEYKKRRDEIISGL